MKLKVIEVKIDLFESHCFVFFDCKMKDAAVWINKNLKGIPAHVPKYLTDNSDNPPQGVCISDVDGKSPNTVVWLSENPHKTNKGVELLTHEATHASFRALKHWGFDIDENTQEILAMYVGFIVKKVMESNENKR